MTNHPSHQPTPAKDTCMPTRTQAGSTPPADRGLLAAWRRFTRVRAALTALVTTAALGAGASPAAAADWGYEQISPADSTSLDVIGVGASKDMGTVIGNTLQTPLAGYPADGRAGQYFYGLPRGGKPWTLGPVNAVNWSQVAVYVRGISVDGTRALYEGPLPSVDGAYTGAYRVDAQGGAVSATGGLISDNAYDSSDDLGTVAFKQGGTVDAPVYVSTPGHAPVIASVDNAGGPMTTTALGDAVGAQASYGLSSGTVAADGSSVIFTSVDGIPGDNDGGATDVYMRILTPGAEQTIAISDPTTGGGADAATGARYRWATADHRRVFFVTAESLESGDTDGEKDLYMRVGTGAPVRISQGETVDGAPTGNATAIDEGERPEWVLSSQDGNRTFFVTTERLTQDAPADGIKLYERDVAEGRTRLVAGPLDARDAIDGTSSLQSGMLLSKTERDINFRGLRVTPNGAVFMSRAPLTGGLDIGTRIFVWTRDVGLTPVQGPPPTAPLSATFLPANPGRSFERKPVEAGRAVSDDGSRVFFTTSQALVPEDTDGGHVDIYMWMATGVRLVTPPGRAPYDAAYIDNSPDGSEVYFTTEESILPGDTDPNAADVYLAILGGGSAPGKPVPDADPQVCVGEACQGPVTGLTPPTIGSVSFAGPGNVPAMPDPVAASVGVSQLKAVTGSVATLKVKVSGGGRISVAGASLRSTSMSASKAATYSVKVALTAGAKSTLKKKRSLKVSARVSYLADDGESASKTVSVTFKQPKAKPAKTKKGGR
jgi:hypothetical protein